MIDIAEDIQGSTLRKNIFPESKKQQELLQKQTKNLACSSVESLNPGVRTARLQEFLGAVRYR